MAETQQPMPMNPQGQPPQYQGQGYPGQQQQGYPGQQQGYPVQQQPGYPGQQPQGMVAVSPQQVQPMVVVGGCPHCGVGQIQEDFTCLGIFCAICCFPIGLICCFLMKDKKCTNCGKNV